LLSGVDEIVTIKGSRVDRLATQDRPSDADLTKALIGPTGRLRAPAARIGRRFIVGFNEGAYRESLS